MQQPRSSRPVDYYLRLATRVRQLASEATTPAVKQRLSDVAREYERVAERLGSDLPAAPPGEF